MPIYEYQCSACGHTMDALQNMSDAPLTDCPACGKPALGKLVSAPSFQLKGTGWYATDFKTKPAEANKTAAADTSTKVEAKSDASITTTVKKDAAGK